MGLVCVLEGKPWERGFVLRCSTVLWVFSRHSRPFRTPFKFGASTHSADFGASTPSAVSILQLAQLLYVAPERALSDFQTLRIARFPGPLTVHLAPWPKEICGSTCCEALALGIRRWAKEERQDEARRQDPRFSMRPSSGQLQSMFRDVFSWNAKNCSARSLPHKHWCKTSQNYNSAF